MLNDPDESVNLYETFPESTKIPMLRMNDFMNKNLYGKASLIKFYSCML
jgi:hypothetical protein